MKVLGASVIGKSHIACGTCNQDFFSIKKKRYGVAMSVCDGVGSNEYSHYGSKAASKAVNKVFKLYYKNKIPKELVGNKIEFFYKKYVKKKYRNAAATTCLFALVYKNSNVLIGQAGDGVILIKLDNKFVVFQHKNDDFMNEVNALSCKTNFNQWKIRNLKFDFLTNNHLSLLLSTDGISEDIIPEKREDFFDYFLKLDSNENLLHVLQEWDAPGSVDDKTVITFEWRR